MSKRPTLRCTARATGWQRTLFQPHNNKSAGQTYAASPMPAKAPYDAYAPIHPPQFKLSATERLELGGSSGEWDIKQTSKNAPRPRRSTPSAWGLFSPLGVCKNSDIEPQTPLVLGWEAIGLERGLTKNKQKRGFLHLAARQIIPVRLRPNHSTANRAIAKSAGHSGPHSGKTSAFSTQRLRGASCSSMSSQSASE